MLHDAVQVYRFGLLTDFGLIRGTPGADFSGKKNYLPWETLSFLPGYEKMCVVRNAFTEESFLCAVPIKGGEYLVLDRSHEKFEGVTKEDLVGIIQKHLIKF